MLLHSSNLPYCTLLFMKDGSVKQLVLMSVHCHCLISTPQDLKCKAEGYLQQGWSQKCSLHVSVQLKSFQFTWLWIKNSDTPGGSANWAYPDILAWMKAAFSFPGQVRFRKEFYFKVGKNSNLLRLPRLKVTFFFFYTAQAHTVVLIAGPFVQCS